MSPLEEAIVYFKEKGGFTHLLRLFGDKVKSLGSIGGSVTIHEPSEEEKRDIGRWMGKRYTNSIHVDLKRFEARFEGTRFEGATLLDVLRSVLQDELVANRVVRNRQQEEQRNYFKDLLIKYDNIFTSFVTSEILAGRNATAFILAYNRGEFAAIEKVYCALVQLFAQKKVRLSVFANKVTGNPHAFDHDPRFLAALQMIHSYLEDEPYRSVSTAEEVNELLFDFGILKDDIANYTTCTGLVAERDGEPLKSWLYACHESSVQNVPLRELNTIGHVYPMKGKQVFVVENSGVFSSLKDLLDEDKRSVALLCTHGQFKLAGLVLINKLVQSGCIIYYSGDYDPEGIQMAARLIRRYPDHVKAWRYSLDDYMKSEPSIDLADTRLVKLKSVPPVFAELADMMRKLGKAGFQEKRISDLYSDLTSI